MDIRWKRPLVALLILSLGGAAGCAGSKPAQADAAAQPTAAPVATPPVPTLRLDPRVRPTGYALELSVDPAKETFAGVVKISLELPEATRFVWLNGSELQVASATIAAQGAAPAPARAVQGGEDFLGFAFEQPVGPGEATLEISYTGRISDQDSQGLFRQQEGGDWYAFTQLEPDDARRVLPCFDEPSFKVPFQLTLKIPAALQGFSNTPVEREQVEEGTKLPGLKTLRFARTQPLPSYLLAFGVGPLDVVDAGVAGVNKVPVRILVPRGRSAEAAYAAQATGPLIDLLEEYFGIPYPYEKLDTLSIPIATGWGAMENAGLITFVSEYLLAKPEADTVERQRAFAVIQAHELAHQWFGDLVTMPWWDDLWLNESFASWMEVGIIDRFGPTWGAQVDQVKTRNQAMQADSLATARRIRQPIRNEGDIQNAFDGITYSKGASVLTMFESYLGKEVFRQGVRAYLEKHALGNATARDFVAAISSAAGRDVAPMFDTFLEQPGVPLVSMKLECPKGGAAPRLQLAQRRYLPVGSQGETDMLWQVPVCVRYRAGKGAPAKACTLLTARTGELVLQGARSCPDWVMPNADMHGYYRAKLEGDELARLVTGAKQQLSLAERVGLLGDAKALTRSGDVEAADALRVANQLLPSNERELLEEASKVASVSEDFIPERLWPNRERFLRRLFGAQARALGLTPKPGESEDTKLLRPELLWTVAVEGKDPELRTQARALALRWLEDRSAVAPELVPLVLRVAAEDADAALHARLLAQAKKSQDRRERSWLLGALGAVKAPALLQKNLETLLGSDFELREAYSLLAEPLQEPDTRDQAYAFLKQNYDALLKRFPRDYGAYITYSVTGFCDEAKRADVAAFFGERTPKLPGGERVLAQTLETVDLCIALKRVQEESLSAFLEKH